MPLQATPDDVIMRLAQPLSPPRRRIVHQVWDWQDESRYVVHLYITREMPNNEWITSHFLGRYRAITPKEIVDYAAHVGFQQIKILPPIDTGYYQPVVMAVRP
jgi:glycine/sarcosine N-methyltransferase